MSAPFASIIIPTRNREGAVRECVLACLRLDYPADRFEVIVVDDGSDPPVGGFADARVRLIRQDSLGPAAARNAGIEAAHGDLLAFIDDDCRPRPDWLSVVAGAWSETPTALLGGRTCNGLPSNGFSTASQFLIDYLYDHFAHRNPRQRFFTSNNLAGSRDRLAAMGGFDPGFPLAAAEDRDLCDRWREHGGTLVYEPRATVDHYHLMSFETFLRQQFRYGRGARVLHRRRVSRGAKYRFELRYFYLGLFMAPFRSMRARPAARTAALLVMAQICNVLGFLYQRET